LGAGPGENLSEIPNLADSVYMADPENAARNEPVAHDAAWMDGYSAALADAIEMVDSLGGPSFANLSAPVLLRMKTRLIEMRGRSAAAA
jgi:hypothetical protein